jgi:hypothetical protein
MNQEVNEKQILKSMVTPSLNFLMII